MESEVTLGEIVIGINQERIVDIEIEKIFNVMADIENYPRILPGNVISVNIINQTTGGLGIEIFFVEEQVLESGVMTTLLVRHSILPYAMHNIEIKDGDAKGTKIKITFDEVDSGTKISTETEIRIKGILAPFGLLLRSNLESALSTSLDSFVDYAKTHG